MKKHPITLLLSAMLSIELLLSGCGNAAAPEHNTTKASISELSNQYTTEGAAETSVSNLLNEDTAETAISNPADESAVNATITSTAASADTLVSQGGPYGKISLSIPDGWRYETCPIDSGQVIYGLYGIRFYPKNAADGYIALNYINGFGVCGTGLEEKKSSIAGQPVNIGTYDNNVYWNFISFGEDYSGVVALTYSVDGWWETYSDQVLDILNTLCFDPDTKEGGAYIYNSAYEPELDQIGLSFSLKNISPTGATLVFHSYDTDAATGELEYGDDFLLEVQKGDIWEEVPIHLDGNYAFNDIAYTIPTEGISERELDWEWLYGALAPGTYRIRKSILDFRGTGDYDKYTAYAQFILNTM